MHIYKNVQWQTLFSAVWAFSTWMHLALTWSSQAFQDQPSISARSPVMETSGEERDTQLRGLNTHPAVSAELIGCLSLMFSIEDDSRMAAQRTGRVTAWLETGELMTDFGKTENRSGFFLLRWWTHLLLLLTCSWVSLESSCRRQKGRDCILKDMSRPTALSPRSYPAGLIIKTKLLLSGTRAALVVLWTQCCEQPSSSGSSLAICFRVKSLAREEEGQSRCWTIRACVYFMPASFSLHSPQNRFFMNKVWGELNCRRCGLKWAGLLGSMIPWSVCRPLIGQVIHRWSDTSGIHSITALPALATIDVLQPIPGDLALRRGTLLTSRQFFEKLAWTDNL